MSRLSHVCDYAYLVLDSRYIAIIYDTMVHAARQFQRYDFGRVCTQERHPVPRLLDELWVVFRELYIQKWPPYIESACHLVFIPVR